MVSREGQAHRRIESGPHPQHLSRAEWPEAGCAWLRPRWPLRSLGRCLSKPEPAQVSMLCVVAVPPRCAQKWSRSGLPCGFRGLQVVAKASKSPLNFVVFGNVAVPSMCPVGPLLALPGSIPGLWSMGLRSYQQRWLPWTEHPSIFQQPHKVQVPGMFDAGGLRGTATCQEGAGYCVKAYPLPEMPP